MQEQEPFLLLKEVEKIYMFSTIIQDRPKYTEEKVVQGYSGFFSDKEDKLLSQKMFKVV